MSSLTLKQNESALVDEVSRRSLVDRFGRTRVGSYAHQSNGMKWWPFDVRSDEVDINAIAHQLAGQNRWQGAVQHPDFIDRMFYSVAEHSVICSHFVPRECRLEALLHDASEAYIGDLIRPLKYDASFRKPFKVVEDAHEQAIAKRFGLQWPWNSYIKKADELVCSAEYRQIVPHSDLEEWETGILHDDSEAADWKITMFSPYEAKQFFLQRFHELYDTEKKCRRL